MNLKNIVLYSDARLVMRDQNPERITTVHHIDYSLGMLTAFPAFRSAISVSKTETL